MRRGGGGVGETMYERVRDLDDALWAADRAPTEASEAADAIEAALDDADRVRAAWAALADAICADYEPWSCDEVARMEVDAAAWVRANHPEWLESDVPAAGSEATP